ncbi:hypothetical protein GA0115240_105818 [Streptomyces sp. DvalAA-14]|uniref:hypothetical protein n=1 Tax=unclassified Streptomyces TaxID=2593676 RepID=UPI00081B17FF|nr:MULTISPECIES: hypothetical protein [unclassified Streptomyces]MYS19167.1 hypothetical protein [Streptomyces sp. SID4948]SCD38199.1 hypothetical protein GA0115240_105818 [Streptomyces sp. DvalAA-14]
MAKEDPTPMTRECAWTGEEFTGPGFVLTTTEGQIIVSEDAFMAPWKKQDQAPAADDGQEQDVAQTGDNPPPAQP